MDTLPDTTRFTQYYSFNDLLKNNLEANLNDSDDHFEFTDGVQNSREVNIYVQMNSKLKIILLISNDMNENLQNDNVIKDVNAFLPF